MDNIVMEQKMFSTEIGKIMEALSKAQSIMEGAKEDSSNPFFKSSYADLSSVWKACRKALAENGLAIVQTTDMINDKPCLVTILGHSSGQWIKGIMALPLIKLDAQSIGSAITYCRRYALAAMVGVAPADDDGEAAMQDARKQQSNSAILCLAPAQIKQIEDRIGDREELYQKMLKWLQVSSLKDVPRNKFEGIIRAIERNINEEGAA